MLDAGEGYTNYFWFADNSTEQTLTINEVGEYIVDVTDAKSCHNSDTIRVGYLGDPTPSFEYTYRLSFEGIYVNFTNTTSNGSSYEWDFGDNTPPIFEESPVHLYEEFFFYQNTFYEVQLWAQNACLREIPPYQQIISLSPTEVQNEDVTVHVYPNPAHDVFSVEFTNTGLIPDRIEVFNPQGKSVWLESDPQLLNEIKATNWTAGVYILTMQDPEGLKYKNVVIK